MEPRGGATAERAGEELRVRPSAFPGMDLHLASTMPLDGLRTRLHLSEHDRADFVLRWRGRSHRPHAPSMPALLEGTLAAWRRWASATVDAVVRRLGAGDGLLSRYLPEEVDPSTGAFLGNHPQAFSHVGVISSGANLARLTACGG